MAGLFGIGGSASSTDRSNQLGSWGTLSGVSNFATKSGEQGISQAQDYFSSLLSGDPSKIATAIGPQASIIQGQAQQQKKNLAEFGDRSGGTAGAASMIDVNTQGSIQNLINSLIPQAANSLASLGLSTLNTGTSAAGTLGSQAGQARVSDQQNESAIGSGIFSLLKNASNLPGVPDFIGTLLGAA